MNIPCKCPFCKGPIWGEGWNPKTEERFYSHVRPEDHKCAGELGLCKGHWRKVS